MRLHEQLGVFEPDEEVEALHASRRAQREEGADTPLVCSDCGEITSDGERCAECLSEWASYYVPDEGGESA